MKTSEDKLNEALRDVLKRKFDDYEEQPKPDALDRIRTRVKPARTFRYWWLTGTMVLVTLSGVLLTRKSGPGLARTDAALKLTDNETLTRQASSSKASNAGHDFGKDPRDQPVTEVHPLHEGTAPGATVNRQNEHRRGSIARDVWSRDDNKTTAAATLADKKSSVAAHVPENKNSAFRANARADKHSGITGNLPPANESSTTAANPLGNKASSIEAHRAEQPENTILASHMPETVTAQAPAHADSALAEMPLEELNAIPLKEATVPLHLRGVVPPRFKPVKRIVTNPAKVAWLANASVLHSYQILTVPSSAAKDFQNFDFPTLFTSRSMGYKFSVGVERRGVQLHLHYSGFRQTYSYEVANNNYLVKPDVNGQYHTVRQGDRIEENRRFSTLGIGLARQLRWGHSPVSRFYAAFGGEYSHDLRSSQSLAWINLGLGKQFAVSRHTAFSIGPYAEFSPVKVKGIENPFYYQPYRVGISAGLRFVRP